MTRALYSLLMWLAQPFLRAKLKRRGIAEPGYLLAMDERFGRYAKLSAPVTGGYLWIHAVSLGETRAAALLIDRLRERCPGMPLLLTHSTATGRVEGATLLRDGDVQAWLPWDAPVAVQGFLAHFRPKFGILMETEVWPNLANACQRAGVPLVLANARLSDKSLNHAQRLGWLSRPAHRSLAAVWAQTDADAQRLESLGAPVQGVFGNLKFDATPNAAQLAQGARWRDAWQHATHRPVVMFASSRAGEEADFLNILQGIRPIARVNESSIATTNVAHHVPSCVQWLIVPRHPQRVDEVAALIESHGFSVSRRSTWRANWRDGGDDGQREGLVAEGLPSRPGGGANNVIWLGDSLGEMALYYGLADVALLGGSYLPLGGQNLIEAAACGCPVVMGPHTFNFAEAAALALKAGAARRVTSLEQAIRLLPDLLNDPATLAAMRAATTSFTAAHCGAVDRTVAALIALLLLHQHRIDAL